MNSKIQIVGDEMYFISSRGIKYALLEGKAMLGISTSDIVFVFLNNPDYDCENYCAGYLFGAALLKEYEKYRNEYIEVLQEMVDKFEKENHLDTINKTNDQMSNEQLATLIFDCLSDGYDDEEYKEDEVPILCNELSQLSDDSILRIAIQRLCERIEDLLE